MENRLGFANYTGNLVTSRLGDLCERIMRKNSENQSDLPLTISSIDGLVDQRDYFNKVVAAKDMSGYYLLKRGEFAYNKSYSVGYDYGTIKRLNKYDEGCLSTLYICFAIKSNAIDSNYLECFFDSLVWYKDMANVCTEGARNHGLLNVDIEEFFNIKVVYPADIEEQKKTAKILNNLDEKIKAEKTNVEKLKALKSSMLTKMFPKEGESVPELRFKGFTDPWEQRELNELALFNPKDELPQTFEYVDLEAVVGTEMLSHRTEARSSAPSRAQRLARAGDLFYQTVRPYQKNNYLFKKHDNNYVFSTGYAQMRPYVDGYFLLSLVQSDCFVKVVLDNCTGTSYPAINANDLAEIEVVSPLDENETQKIGAIFHSIDSLITLHQRKYEKLLDVKKAFLEKMIGGDN